VAARWRSFDAAAVRAAACNARWRCERTPHARTAPRTPHPADPDDFYDELIGSQRDLSDDEAR
jgi:hypothetical protein